MSLPLASCLRVRAPEPPFRSDRGLTLVEILVVIAIIGLLVGVLVVNTDVFLGGSKESAADLFVNETVKAPLVAFHMHMGRYPTTEEGLNALVTAPLGGEGRWRGPYLERLPLDPWGNPYQYRVPSTRSGLAYDVYSWGPDGQDNETNIGNW